MSAKAAHISASKLEVGDERDLEKQPLLEMPAARKGVASTKQGKGCLGTPERQGKTNVLAKIISQRGPKGLRSKKIRAERDVFLVMNDNLYE